MKVVLVKDVSGVGRRGELKDVAEGYGKNFLLARGLAELATGNVQARLTKEAKEAEAKLARERERARELAGKLSGKTVVVTVKVGPQGQLYGAVHEQDIAKAAGLATVQVALKKAIKTLGDHPVTFRVAPGVTAEATVRIEPQHP